MKVFANIARVPVLGIVCCLLLLSACVTSVSKVSTIEERVTARLDALLTGDLAGAYEYLSPGYRSSVTSLQYQRSILLKRVAWTSAKYVESECEAATCKVKISVGFTVSGAVPGVSSYKGTQIIEESWVLIDGQWYLVPA